MLVYPYFSPCPLYCVDPTFFSPHVLPLLHSLSLIVPVSNPAIALPFLRSRLSLCMPASVLLSFDPDPYLLFLCLSQRLQTSLSARSCLQHASMPESVLRSPYLGRPRSSAIFPSVRRPIMTHRTSAPQCTAVQPNSHSRVAPSCDPLARPRRRRPAQRPPTRSPTTRTLSTHTRYLLQHPRLCMMEQQLPS